MRNLILTLSVTLGLIGGAPTGAGATVYGVGDQYASMFVSPAFLALHVHEARLNVPWNIATAPSERGALAGVATWLSAAQDAGVTPLVSFNGNGNYIPTVNEYTAAVRAFMRRFPTVIRYTPWNEPDWIYRKLSREPLLAAAFYNALVRSCSGCTVLAGDLYLPARQLGPWLRSYIKGLRYRPAGWALHNYYDVRAHATAQLTTLLSLTSGPVWLDEISGVERRGHWPYANQSVPAAGRDEQFMLSLARRFSRISRIYHYQWRAIPTQGWDSALLDPSGHPRPAYYELAKAIGS